MKTQTLLMIEDETAIRDMLRFALSNTHFELLEADDVTHAENILANTIPDLILLDWMLPSKSGIHFIQWLKQHALLRNIPIIMLTAKAEEHNKVRALEAGADDYITKPFSPLELITRIKTVLRRGPLIQPSGTITIEKLELNTITHEVNIDDILLYLTPIEYRLLHFFMTHPNHVYSRDQLLTYVWGQTAYLDERTVDVQVRRLRDRLKPFNYQRLIQTVRGAGYKFSGSLHER